MSQKEERITKKELFEAYEEAKKTGVSCVVLFIHMPTGETEAITNPNVEEKMKYVDKTYDENLVHANCKEIYIEDFVFADDVDNFDFGCAINVLKEGGKVARKGWNGRDQYLTYIDPYVNDQFTLIEEKPLGTFYPFIAIKTNYNAIVPWFPSQTDMLAEDWYEVEEFSDSEQEVINPEEKC